MKKVFISYSWDNENHKNWVRRFADDLITNGVFVYLDQYDLFAGANMTHYIDNVINDSDHVLIIMTPNYKKKAENRKGGVGYEYSICNKKLFENQKDNRKFIPILRKGDENRSVPEFLKSFVRLNLSNDRNYDIDFKTVLASIYLDLGTSRPKLGNKPSSLDETIVEQYHFIPIKIEEIKTTGLTGPLVLFFGPPNIGKTMALIRLLRFLKNKYQVSIMKGFRSDELYKSVTYEFNKSLYQSEYAPFATSTVSYLLVNLSDIYGNTISQFIDVAGEHFYSHYNFDYNPPHYLSRIFSSNFSKIYVIFFDPDIIDNIKEFQFYIDQLSSFFIKNFVPKRDKVILLYSKSDKRETYIAEGKPVFNLYKRDVYGKNSFYKLNETLKSLKINNVPFIPFSSGEVYIEPDSNKLRVRESNDYFPELLWKNINKQLQYKSGFFNWLNNI